MSAPSIQRPPAEVRYQAELARLIAQDTAPRPPGWRLSLQAKPVANGSGHVGWVTPDNEAAWQQVHSE